MQATRTCSVEGCQGRFHSAGFCSVHAHRNRRYGDPLAGGPPLAKYPGETLEERFWARVDPSGVCWEWQGQRVKGYGRLWTPEKPVVPAHRWAYENLVGPIPEGMTLDHLCRNHACVNPDHMDLCTRGENAMRGSGPAAMNARKTQCRNGHAFDEDNTYITAEGRRQCRQCRRSTDTLNPLGMVS